MKGKERFR